MSDRTETEKALTAMNRAAANARHDASTSLSPSSSARKIAKMPSPMNFNTSPPRSSIGGTMQS